MSFALPLFIMAIGGIYSERGGVTNLALEGLQGMGAFIGALAATLAAAGGIGNDQTRIIAFLFAAVGGGLYACVHALLCIRFKANQVISGVVINILAMALTSFLTKAINRTMFGAASNIIIVALVMWFILYRTTLGLRLRACGDNPHAVDAAGGDVAKVRFFGVVVSGALSGIAGMCFAYSILAKFSSDIYMGYGYLSIASYIFGNWSMLPTLAACLIFGFARSGGYQLVKALGMPSAYSDLVMILPYVLTLFLLVFLSKKNRSPKALGETYDKSKR